MGSRSAALIRVTRGQARQIPSAPRQSAHGQPSERAPTALATAIAPRPLTAIPVFAPGERAPVCSALPRIALQRKLAIGAVDDPLKHEADRVADRVMRMPDSALAAWTAPLQLSRKCEACEDDDKLKLQKKSAGPAEPRTAPPIVHEVLRSPGRPLDPETRAFFEPRFGYDFSRVRVHADEPAARAAFSIGARAFTSGSAIAFGAGAYAPRTQSGRQLLSHELAHVVQQQHLDAPGGDRRLQRESDRKRDDPLWLPDPRLFRQMQEQSDRKAMIDKLKAPIVQQIAMGYWGYLSQRITVEKPHAIATYLPLAMPAAADSYKTIYDAINDAIDIKKTGKGNKIEDWVWREAPAREQTTEEKTAKVGKFLLGQGLDVVKDRGEDYIKDQAVRQGAKYAKYVVEYTDVAATWLAEGALEATIGLIGVVSGAAEVALVASLVLDVFELAESLEEPGEMSPAEAHTAGIVAGVRAWLQAKQQADQVRGPLGAPIQVPIVPAVRDKTDVRSR